MRVRIRHDAVVTMKVRGNTQGLTVVEWKVETGAGSSINFKEGRAGSMRGAARDARKAQRRLP